MATSFPSGKQGGDLCKPLVVGAVVEWLSHNKQRPEGTNIPARGVSDPRSEVRKSYNCCMISSIESRMIQDS
jgi:hypothetical protein